MDLERRYVPLASATITVEDRANGMPTIRGISPPWRSLSYDLGGFREQFVDTAFDEALASNPDVLGLFNHDENQVLARTSSGTMKIAKGPTGLGYEMDAPETTMARDLMVLIRRGDISGSSFAFSLRAAGTNKGEEWSQGPDGMYVRTVTNANIYDVSVVSRPAYPAATAAVRSFEAFKAANLTAGEQAQIAEQVADDLADKKRRMSQAEFDAAAVVAKAKVYGL